MITLLRVDFTVSLSCTLLDYTLFYPNDYKKNDKITYKYFKNKNDKKM